jgi:hypothetical protein
MLLKLSNFSFPGAGTWLPYLSSKRQRIAFPACSTLFRMIRESFLLVLSPPTSCSGRTVTPDFSNSLYSCHYLLPMPYCNPPPPPPPPLDPFWKVLFRTKYLIIAYFVAGRLGYLANIDCDEKTLRTAILVQVESDVSFFSLNFP